MLAAHLTKSNYGLFSFFPYCSWTAVGPCVHNKNFRHLSCKVSIEQVNNVHKSVLCLKPTIYSPPVGVRYIFMGSCKYLSMIVAGRRLCGFSDSCYNLSTCRPCAKHAVNFCALMPEYIKVVCAIRVRKIRLHTVYNLRVKV